MKITILAPFVHYGRSVLTRNIIDPSRETLLPEKDQDKLESYFKCNPHVEKLISKRSVSPTPHFRYDLIHREGRYLTPLVFELEIILASLDIKVASNVFYAHDHTTLGPSHFVLKFYDSPISIVQLDYSLDWSPDVFLSNIEIFRSHLYPLLVNIAHSSMTHIIHPFISWVEDNDPLSTIKTQSRSISLTPESRYSDNDVQTPLSCQVLWANQTICSDNFSASDIEKYKSYWLRSDKLYVTNSDSAGLYYFDWGRNLFQDSPQSGKWAHTFDTLVMSQYYYAILDLINLKLDQLTRRVLGELKTRDLKKISREVRHLSAHTEISISSYRDALQMILASQRDNSKILYELYDFDSLINNVKSKTSSLNLLVDNLHDSSTKSYQKAVSIFVFILGGISIIELATIISDYSTTKDIEHFTPIASDGFPGILDLAYRTPPDFIVTFSLVLVISMCLIYLFYENKKM